MTTHIDGIDDLESRVGQQIGYSEWHSITPEQVQKFAEATGDFQWIHLDDEKAKAGPFGTTIAHGYLTLSVSPYVYVRGIRHRWRRPNGSQLWG